MRKIAFSGYELISLTTLGVVVLFALSCSSNKGSAGGGSEGQTGDSDEVLGKGQSAVQDGVSEKNVFQVAESTNDFEALVAAVKAANVEDALVNAGPLTVFAPLNSAFEKLPEGTLETLLKPENKAKLAFILINHVAPSNYPIVQLKKEAKRKRDLFMASGNYLKIEVKGDDVYVGNTKILKSVKVSNGWIHVIDDVLIPTEKQLPEVKQ